MYFNEIKWELINFASLFHVNIFKFIFVLQNLKCASSTFRSVKNDVWER